MNIDILQQPNIPKPLHGLNPRTIKGKSWWDTTRQQAYKSTDYTCLACGIHKTQAMFHNWLEAHEDYHIDYQTGIVKVKRIIPLCHSCHNFIHSGRLYRTYQTKDTNYYKIKTILEHGFKLLSENNLKCFSSTLLIANHLNNINTYNIKCYTSSTQFAAWSQWRLVLEGKEYYSQFKNISEWENFYQN